MCTYTREIYARKYWGNAWKGSTFTFTCELLIIASILCTRVNLRAYSRKKYTTVEIANKFVHFFAEKIVNIRSSLGTPVIPEYFKTLDISSLTCQLVNFAPPSNIELSNITNNIIMKSCILDPLPVTLLKQHFDLLLPIILTILSTCHWNPVIFRLLWKLLFYQATT